MRVIFFSPGRRLITAPSLTPDNISGGEGQRWWFLNGEPLDGHQKNYSLQLYLPGKYQLIVLDETGQTVTVNFELDR
ncbi:hypothetical protein [Enterobacter hormaechei]|uniref:hypothetical protein n=1 Tax=Enterobacter hormaechei TaxID=158836 RepID=UPI000ADBF10E